MEPLELNYIWFCVFWKKTASTLVSFFDAPLRRSLRRAFVQSKKSFKRQGNSKNSKSRHLSSGHLRKKAWNQRRSEEDAQAKHRSTNKSAIVIGSTSYTFWPRSICTHWLVKGFPSLFGTLIWNLCLETLSEHLCRTFKRGTFMSQKHYWQRQTFKPLGKTLFEKSNNHMFERFFCF